MVLASSKKVSVRSTIIPLVIILNTQTHKTSEIDPVQLQKIYQLLGAVTAQLALLHVGDATVQQLYLDDFATLESKDSADLADC